MWKQPNGNKNQDSTLETILSSMRKREHVAINRGQYIFAVYRCNIIKGSENKSQRSLNSMIILKVELWF